MPYMAHRVKQGECISSIAQRYGMAPDTIWDDAKNGALKRERGDPNVLFPGDTVHVRVKEAKQGSYAVDKRHRFRRKGVPAFLRLRLLRDGEPRSNVPYTLEVGGRSLSKATSADGLIEHPIPPSATEAVLTIDGTERYDLRLGNLDPVTEASGARARLVNLGYLAASSALGGPEIEEAIRTMQAENGLQPTGTLDGPTQSKLRELHGS